MAQPKALRETACRGLVLQGMARIAENDFNKAAIKRQEGRKTMLKINRRTFAAGSAALAFGPRVADAQDKKNLLRFVQNGNLTILDPIWTTAYVTRDHGYMNYDVLFAPAEKGVIHPQMVDKYEVSADKT